MSRVTKSSQLGSCVASYDNPTSQTLEDAKVDQSLCVLL
jgi:hypothetical protein